MTMKKKVLIPVSAIILAVVAFLILLAVRPGLIIRGEHFVRRQITAVTDKDEKIMNVPLITQTRNLNCEATTAQMILQYYGKNTTIDQVQNALPLDPNPHKGFRGNVDGPIWGFTDYGVYAEPIADVMTKLGVPSKSYSNITQDFLKQKILAGKPAIVWVDIANPHPETKEFIINGETVKLLSGEHVAVVTGYSHGRWILNDPWNSSAKDGTRVSKQIKVDNLDDIHWNDFDHMAVIVE
jgi:uncharacterized protein YvpB